MDIHSSGVIRVGSNASLDEELAQVTSNLTVGPSPVTTLINTSFVMPPLHKLCPNLYNNSMKDISMDVKTSNADTQIPSDGVPGFPDFPSIWTGETSHNQRRNKRSPCKKPKNKSRIKRKAVNTPFGSSTVSSTSISKAMKLRARAERKLHRLEKCVKLKEKRRRKKDIGDLCKGMAGMCK